MAEFTVFFLIRRSAFLAFLGVLSWCTVCPLGAIAASNSEADRLSSKAYHLAEQGQYESSIRLWEEALKKYKRSDRQKEVAETIIEIAQAKRANGQGVAACITLQQYLKANPNLCIPANGVPTIQPPQIGAASEDAIIAINFAQIIKDFGLFEPAKHYAEAAIASATQHNYPEIIPDLAILTANIDLFHLMYDRDQLLFRETTNLPDADADVLIQRFAELFKTYEKQFQSPLQLEARLKWLTTYQELLKQTKLFRNNTLNSYPINLTDQYLALLQNLGETHDLDQFSPAEQLRLKLEIARIQHEAHKNNPDRKLQIASYQWTLDLIESAQAISHQQFLASGYALLAEQYQFNGQIESALQAYHRASKNSDITHPRYKWQYEMAKLFDQLEDERQAERFYTSAIALIDEAQWNMSPLEQSIKSQFQETVRPVYDDFIRFQLGKDEPEFDKVLELRNYYIDKVVEVYLGCGNVESLPLNELYTSDPQAAFISIFKVGEQYYTLLKNGDRYEWNTADANAIDPVLFRLIGIFESDGVKVGIPTVNSEYKTLYQLLLAPVFGQIDPGQPILFTHIDPKLQQIPLSAMYDGKSYLVEDHPIALIGNTIYEPKSLDLGQLEVFFAGISNQPDTNTRLGSLNLPYVIEESERINPDETIINQKFTKSNFFNNIKQDFPIVHVATHGQFSSQPEETFLVAWDGPLDLADLSQSLQARTLDSPIELLVLSACETANGDRYATLGIAGFSIQAGARSTLATLWQAIDSSSPFLMERFYNYLRKGKTKASALQLAQKDMIRAGFPLYSWANSILIGSWL